MVAGVIHWRVVPADLPSSLAANWRHRYIKVEREKCAQNSTIEASIAPANATRPNSGTL